jgi:hypothetical protein
VLGAGLLLATGLVAWIALRWATEPTGEPPTDRAAPGILEPEPRQWTVEAAAPARSTRTRSASTEAAGPRSPEPDASPAPSSSLDDDAFPAHLSGWLASPAGELLAQHSVVVSWARSPSLAAGSKDTVTGSDGWFLVSDLPETTVEIRVQGPGEGDVREYRSTSWREARARAAELRPRSLEGATSLHLPSGGVDELTLVSRLHPAFWVAGRVVGMQAPPQEDGQPAGRDTGWRWVHVRLTRPGGEDGAVALSDAGDPPATPLGRGPLIELHAEPNDTSSDGDGAFLAGAMTAADTRMVVSSQGHRTIVLDLPEAPRLGHVDVGDLRTEPVGEIAALVMDARFGQEVPAPKLSARASGGGWPDAALGVSWDDDALCWKVRTDRSHGSCELRVEAPGYTPAVLVVELQPFLQAELDLLLERAPP